MPLRNTIVALDAEHDRRTELERAVENLEGRILREVQEKLSLSDQLVRTEKLPPTPLTLLQIEEELARKELEKIFVEKITSLSQLLMNVDET